MVIARQLEINEVESSLAASIKAVEVSVHDFKIVQMHYHHHVTYYISVMECYATVLKMVRSSIKLCICSEKKLVCKTNT